MGVQFGEIFLGNIQFKSNRINQLHSLGSTGNKNITKVGSAENCQALLQQFNIKGSSTVDRIFASRDFTEFAALDNAGLAYILKEVEIPYSFQ